MNTDTNGQQGTSMAPASTQAPAALSPALADLKRQRLEIDTLIETLIKAQEEVMQKDNGLRQEVVKTLPQLLGVGRMSEALEYLASYTDSSTWKPRPHTRHLSMDQKKAQAIALRVKGWKTDDIAREVGVSSASCWLWFRKAGLSNIGLGGKRRSPATG